MSARCNSCERELLVVSVKHVKFLLEKSQLTVPV